MITPAEYLELIELGNEAAGAHSMNAIAVLTAYLVAAYFVGRQLTRFQSIAVTGLYSVFYFFTVIATFITLERTLLYQREFSIEHPEVSEKFVTLQFDGMQFVVIFILLLAWVVSVGFMRSARNEQST